MTSLASLITVTYNSERQLQQHWSRTSSLAYEWIVVDNASTDGSADLAEELGANVIRLDSNVGFSAANNIGASIATGRCLIFVNPDVTVTGDGIRELAHLALNTGALVAPQLLNPDGSLQENGRTAPYLYRKVAHFLGLRSSHANYEVIADSTSVMSISWAIGAAIAITRDAFDTIGGWDPGYFIYYEDSDLCLRAQSAGFPTVLAGRVRWIHGWGRATRRQFSWSAWRHELRSGARFYRRYPELLLHPRVQWGARPTYEGRGLGSCI